MSIDMFIQKEMSMMSEQVLPVAVIGRVRLGWRRLRT